MSQKVKITRSAQMMSDIVFFAFYTGLRLMEQLNLKVRNIDLIEMLITVGDNKFKTKTRRQRVVPISEKLVSIIERRVAGKSKDDYVFAFLNGKRFTGDYVSKTFKKACRRAGIDEEIRYHSLRHSFCSNLVQQGVSLYVVKELAGHSSISTTEIYSHLNLKTLQEAIRKLD